ncbi:Uncharacterised protein [Mycobacterium tuberculosis]|uniref:Uncharacterized protein n=1 Tax=Mycobacterium tuberculosis TaxID=1773 RepID=A0A916LFU1_MYCTX|nr:Uncharacterised protein [Mycobacterium tuberculosis]
MQLLEQRRLTSLPWTIDQHDTGVLRNLAQLFEHVPLDQLVTSLIMHHNVKVLLFCRTSDPDLSNSLSCFVDHWILFCRKTYLDLSTIVGLVAVVDLPGAGDWLNRPGESGDSLI